MVGDAAAAQSAGGGAVTAAAEDLAFAALADPTRRAVVRALVRAPLRAGELATRVGASAPALSRHLRVLKRAGVVTDEGVEADARVRVYRLAPLALEPVRGWLAEVEQAWGEHLAAFRDYAEGVAAMPRPGPAPTWPAVPQAAPPEDPRTPGAGRTRRPR